MILHFLASVAAAAEGDFAIVAAWDISACELAAAYPSFSVVSAFLRSPLRESISFSRYCFCIPNLKGGAMSEPSRVSAVAFDWMVRTEMSL